MSLVSVQSIKELIPIPDADRIEIALVLGYKVVVPKHQYMVDELVLFIQPDSVLPKADWSEPFMKHGDRVRAIKFRGQWSFGIIQPFELLTELGVPLGTAFPVGADVSDILGVTKYTPPPRSNESLKDGGLPLMLPKTYEELYKNLVDTTRFQSMLGQLVDVTLKIDGESCTAFYSTKEERFGLTQRAAELVLSKSNNYTNHIEKHNLEVKISNFCKENGVSLALRGESHGKGIKGGDRNPYSKVEKDIHFYSVYNMDTREYERYDDPYHYTKVCSVLNLPVVPIIEQGVVLTMELIDKYENMKRLNGDPFEGVVITARNGGSFKVINMHYDSQKN